MSNVAETNALPSATTRQPSPVAWPLSRAECAVVASISLLLCVVFAWTYVLPWDKFTPFTVLSISLSVSHVLLSVVLMVPQGRRFRLPVWRFTSCLALLVLAWGTWAIFSSSWYISQLYGGLGKGISAALIAIWALLLLTTLPLAAWGLVRSKGYSLRSALKITLGGLFVVLMLGATPGAEQPTHEANVEQAAQWDAFVRNDIAPLIKSLTQVPPGATWSKDVIKRPAKCEETPGEAQTALAFFRGNDAELTSRCWQAPSLPELAAKVATGLKELAVSDVVVLDRITTRRQVRTGSPLLDPLTLRPGLDGACVDGKCLAPWQLVAQNLFTTHAPLAFLGDLKFGLSVKALRKRLAGKNTEAGDLIAIGTQSLNIDPQGGVLALRRHHPALVPVDASTTARAATGYAAHIIAAQQPNGQFRYTLDPFSGKADIRNFSIPRQAGTLLVLCELGANTKEVNQTVRLGLQLLLEHRRIRGEFWALSLDKRARLVRLGDSALPLVALAACRERMGTQFDDAIRGLTAFVLHQQQPDGSFTSTYDWRNSRPDGGEEALYAPGQALLGLILVDRLVREAGSARQNGSPPLGSRETLTAAIQRGMNHVAHEHWDTAMYSFFFVEENWNCLAARAALKHQRNDDYERFCIDYMRFKSRLILDEQSEVAAEFWGGFGFGNIIPPHNTGAAGVGEALAALVAVKRARGEDTTSDEVVLASVLGFLLRQQWTPDTCFACAPQVVGSMSEFIHSPVTRIDFTQHAWAAVGHGAKVLGLHGE